jgi:catechol 2,3-dioxygenase-like lactoylglutathione lyase family enzyme
MRVHHVALRVRDLAAAERFWVGLFGLSVRRRDGARALWLGLDDAVLMLERAEAAEPAVPTGAMDFFALRVDAAGRAGFVARCAAMGVAVEHETAHTTYVRDPDGRRVGVSTHPLAD